MRTLSFLLGIIIFAVCLAAPLPALDYNDPFSSHMLRHTALLLLAAPLLAMAIPPANFAKKRLIGLSRLTARLPLIAWLAGMFMMWLWHLPGWYNSTAGQYTNTVSCAPLSAVFFSHPGSSPVLSSSWMMVDRVIPLLHDLSLVLAGFLFCWPVITPYNSFRLPPLRAILYLASACICCSLLGLLITFAPPGTYRGIGLVDQQTGGLIMWVPCCLVYLTASMSLLIHWLSEKDGITRYTHLNIK